MKLKISNPDLSGEERTYLTQDLSASGTTLNVRNVKGFTSGWYGVLGVPGQEQTEAVLVTNAATTDTSMTAGACKFSHPKSTAVYQSQWNQLSVERKPSAGSYSELAKYDIEWDNDDNKTLIVVSGGATSDTYRWRFYNANTGTYSDYSDELAGTGLARNSVGHLIEQVRRNPVAKNIKDEIIIDYFNDYQTDVVYPELQTAWWFTKEGSQLATTASTYKYSISDNWSDFRAKKFLLYRYISGDVDITYPLSWSPPSEFYNYKSDANQADDDYVRYWSLLPPDDSSALGYIGLHPTPKTANCYIKPVYFFELSNLDSFGDTIVIPHSKGYIDYALYRIYDDIKRDTSNANKYSSRVAQSITSLKKLNRRQLGQKEWKRWRGRRGWSRLFGEQATSTGQTQKEMYW